VTSATTNSINTDPHHYEEIDGEGGQMMRPSFLDDDVDQARSDAELEKRRRVIIEKLENLDDSNPTQIIKSK
jgi:hypothetical protein